MRTGLYQSHELNVTTTKHPTTKIHIGFLRITVFLSIFVCIMTTTMSHIGQYWTHVQWYQYISDRPISADNTDQPIYQSGCWIVICLVDGFMGIWIFQISFRVHLVYRFHILLCVMQWGTRIGLGLGLGFGLGVDAFQPCPGPGLDLISTP